MNRNNFVGLVFALSLVSVAACSGEEGTTDDTIAAFGKDGGTASAGAVIPSGLHWFRTSAEYRAGARQAYFAATASLQSIVKERTGFKPWGVVLDVDETVLNNSQYQLERANAGLGYTPESWSEWAAKRSAPAIPGVVAFLESVRRAGGKVVLVTNRIEADCRATEDNLRRDNVVYDQILCAPDPTVRDKNPRFEAVLKGQSPSKLPALDVVMFVGDNIQDFPSLTQESKKDERVMDLFGDRYIMIPNPMYGSWEKNAME